MFGFNKSKFFTTLFVIAIIIGPVFVYISAKQINAPVGYVAIVENSQYHTIDVIGDGRNPYWDPMGALDIATSVKYVYVGICTVYMGGSSSSIAYERNHEYGWDAISALSNDGVGLEVDCTVVWKLDPSKVVDLYRDFPSQNWVDMIIIPAIREEVRIELSKYSALTIVENRTVVIDYVLTAIENKLRNLEGDSDAIIYVDSYVREIRLPDAYVQALEEKATAEQRAIAALFQAQEIITLAEADAEALLIQARAQANASLVLANASAEAVYIQAQTIAEAVELLANVTGTDNATQIAMMYLWIQALQVIANSSGNPTYFITFGSNGIPYVYTIEPEG